MNFILFASLEFPIVYGKINISKDVTYVFVEQRKKEIKYARAWKVAFHSVYSPFPPI